MAPPTRLNPYRTPPRSPLAGRDATTRRRTKFFDALTDNKGAIPLTRISKKCGISESCGRKWKEIWQNEGDEGKRHPRQRSKVLGRNSRVTKSMCKMLCSPSRNPVRKQPYEAQIAYHKLPVKTRQLQNKLREYTKGGARYKCAFVKKVISDKNKEEREKYGNDYNVRGWTPIKPGLRQGDQYRTGKGPRTARPPPELVAIATNCLRAVYIRVGGTQSSWLLIEFNHSHSEPILSELFEYSP